ncbi:putative reverse transcriptase domain-containing protein [Tanacetum coccineum]
MPPKSAPLTQAAIHRMIKESVDAATAVERARHTNAGNDAKGSGPVRGQDAAPAVQGKKVKCVAATLQGPALTWWNAKVATMGLETVNQMPWTKMKQLMTAEFCLIEELQRMEHELWNLKVKEYNIVAYTQRFNELALMCPRMVEPESVKVDAYIRGLTDNIKGEVTSSKPANLNKAGNLIDVKSISNESNNYVTQPENPEAMVVSFEGAMAPLKIKARVRCREVVMVQKSKMVTSSLLSVQLMVVAYKEVMEVLVRCWSDGDVVVRSCSFFLAAVKMSGSAGSHSKSASLTQRMGSNIPTVFSWGSSIGPEGFMSSILLLVVIIVVVVIVVVTVVLVVVVVEGWAYAFHQDKASSVRVPVANVTLFSSAHLLRENTDSVRVPVGLVFLLGLLVLAIDAAYASRVAETLSATRTGSLPNGRVDLTGNEDPTYEDGDIGMGVSLGGGISSGGKKSRESNIGGSENTRDGGTTVGVEYERVGEAIGTKPDELFKDSEEVFPGEAGK